MLGYRDRFRLLVANGFNLNSLKLLLLWSELGLGTGRTDPAVFPGDRD